MRMLCLLAGVLSAFLSPSAVAHRLNLVTSDIVWQVDDRAFEITHTLHLDDALTLLASLGVDDGVLDLPASARLMHYLGQRFELATAEAKLVIEPFGAHINDGVLYIYQRAALNALPPALEVRNSLLHDQVSNPQNQVNWRVGDIVRSYSGGPDQPVSWLALAPKRNRTDAETH